MEGQGRRYCFRERGDPQLGEWDDAAILDRYDMCPTI